MQGKYGAALLSRLDVPTIKYHTPELVQLPFNQCRYDKDFDNAVTEFFNDKSKLNDPSKLELKQVDSAIGNYLTLK